MKQRYVLTTLCAIALLMSGCITQDTETSTNTNAATNTNSNSDTTETINLNTNQVTKETAMESNEDRGKMEKKAVVKTNKGTMEIGLYTEKAPLTTGNFIDLVNKDFYNGLIFHRVIADFMIQGGDPNGTGSGGPGYTIDDEFDGALIHDKKGVLSMANAGPNTGGSQFFITLVPTPWLDGKHAVFGEIIAGQDVLDAIGKVETVAADKPVEDIVIETITIEDNA